MDVVKLLNELENWIEDRKTIMGGVCTNFDKEEILDLTSKIRSALPDDVKRANRLTQEKDRVLSGARQTAEATLEDAHAEADRISREARANAERTLREAETEADKVKKAAEMKAKDLLDGAHAKADKMLAEAQQKSEALVAESEVVRLASAQAREIVSSAEYDSKDLRRGADEYAHGVLVELEKHVGELMHTIERGRRKLDQRVQPNADRKPSSAPPQNGVAQQDLAGASR